MLTAKKNSNKRDSLDIAMASHQIKIRLCLIHHPERRDLALPKTAVREDSFNVTSGYDECEVKEHFDGPSSVLPFSSGAETTAIR